MPHIHTFTGAKLDFLNPQPEQIMIADIAKGLSNTSRYSGQTAQFYSVAQHSILIARFGKPKNRLAALLHDAPEAYLGDPVTNLKPLLPDYSTVEKRLWLAICDKFDLNQIVPAEIKELDKLICVNEMAELSTVNPYPSDAPRLGGITIIPWTPFEAFQAFMREFAAVKRTLIAC